MKPRPVFIEWADAADLGCCEWLDLDDMDPAHVAPCGVVSVGWLVSRSESAVLLALSLSEAGDARGAFLVPVSAIKRMVRLKPDG